MRFFKNIINKIFGGKNVPIETDPITIVDVFNEGKHVGYNVTIGTETTFISKMHPSADEIANRMTLTELSKRTLGIEAQLYSSKDLNKKNK